MLAAAARSSIFLEKALVQRSEPTHPPPQRVPAAQPCHTPGSFGRHPGHDVRRGEAELAKSPEPRREAYSARLPARTSLARRQIVRISLTTACSSAIRRGVGGCDNLSSIAVPDDLL
jgi:hypothetical protein